MAGEAIRAIQPRFTAAMEGLTAWTTDTSTRAMRSGQRAVGKENRLLRESGGSLGLEHSLQGVRWRSGAQAAEVDHGGSVGDYAECQRRDLGEGDRAASAQVRWMMHDLQLSSFEDRVSGR